MRAALRLDRGRLAAQGGVGELHQAAVAAAVGQLAGQVRFHRGQADPGAEGAHAGAQLRLVARGAGVVQGEHRGRHRRPVRGQLQFGEHLVQRTGGDVRGKGGKHPQAGGTGDHHRGPAQALDLGRELVENGRELVVAAGPVGRDAAAVEQQADPARELGAEQLVGAPDRVRGRADELTAGVEEVAAGRGPRLVAGEAAVLGAAEGHVLQGELVGRRRHVAGLDHGPAAGAANLGHREIVGTDDRALAAEAAAVDHPVGAARPLDDGLAVEDLAHQGFRVLLVFPQVDALLDALQTLALQAAAGLLPGLVFTVAARGVRRDNGRKRRYAVDNGVHPRRPGALQVALGGDGDLLQEPLDGQGRPAAGLHLADQRKTAPGQGAAAAKPAGARQGQGQRVGTAETFGHKPGFEVVEIQVQNVVVIGQGLQHGRGERGIGLQSHAVAGEQIDRAGQHLRRHVNSPAERTAGRVARGE